MSNKYRYLLLTIVFVVFAPFGSIAQVSWQYDLEHALKLAKANGQLVFIDFYADWCGPCRKMDGDVWAKAEINEATEGIIMAKVDIDRYPAIAKAYSVTAIPRMMLIDPFENKIDEITGYQDLSGMQRFLEDYPSDISNIVAALSRLEGKENETFANYLSTGNAFTAHVGSIEGKAQLKFASRASFYFNRAAKQAKKEGDPQLNNELIVAETELAMYQENFKKALKMLEEFDKAQASTDQLKALDEMCITCLFKEEKPDEAKKIYENYTTAYDAPKTFDQLVGGQE
jgi:thioredoxin-like negative regulator of GroEL